MSSFMKGARRLRRMVPAIGVVSVLLLAGCGGNNMEYEYPEGPSNRRSGQVYESERNNASIFGPGGITLMGKRKQPEGEGGGSGIGVNSFLWRASLDTISFMPLVSADPFGGVIITDWYSMPETPNERFKMNVYILGRQLRADGLRVAVFRQTREAGGWVTAKVNVQTGTQLENKILDRARELRISTAAN